MFLFEMTNQHVACPVGRDSANTPDQSRPPASLRTGPTRDPGVAAQSRRRFVKQVVLGSVLSSMLGKEWVGTLVADCAPSAPGAGILRLRLSSFPALQAANGSIRVALNRFTNQGAIGAFYPILVNRGQGNEFHALSARCTHSGCVVPAGGAACPCHGSRFDLTGAVLQGPATTPLARYPISFDGVDTLCIEIPNLGYSLTGATVGTGPNARFRLQFQTRLGVKYEVRFQSSVDQPGVVVPFATTESGEAVNTVLTGNNAVAIIFVDPAGDRGFYSVAVQVTEG